MKVEIFGIGIHLILQMEDFDNHGHTWMDGYIYMEYDWTHSNALWFDESESAIYMSSRHLSRISKIDYPSGELLYNITYHLPILLMVHLILEIICCLTSSIILSNWKMEIIRCLIMGISVISCLNTVTVFLGALSLRS